MRKKVKERFGGNIRCLVSGGAALNYEVGLFLMALGLPLLQGYGQTETAPVISSNPLSKIKIEVFTGEYGLHTPAGREITPTRELSTSCFLRVLYAVPVWKMIPSGTMIPALPLGFRCSIM